MSFCPYIPTGYHIFDTILFCLLVHERDYRMIAWNFRIRCGCLEKGNLKISKFFPIDYMSLQINIEQIKFFIDIIHCQFRIPPIIKVNRKRTQAQLLHFIGYKGTIHTPTYTNETIVFLVFPFFFNYVHNLPKAFFSRVSCKYFLMNFPVIIMAMVAHPVGVKTNIGIRCIHYTTCTYLVGPNHGASHIFSIC